MHLGILDAGANKKITEFGKRLGRALEHNQETDTRRLLAEAVATSKFLSDVVSSIRIKGTIAEESLVSHILYVAGQKNSAASRTGARSIIELLKDSAVVTEAGGNYSVSTTPPSAPPQNPPPIQNDRVENGEGTKDFSNAQETAVLQRDASERRNGHQVFAVQHPSRPNITINISLQLPDTADAQVYENFFRSMKTHLLADE